MKPSSALALTAGLLLAAPLAQAGTPPATPAAASAKPAASPAAAAKSVATATTPATPVTAPGGTTATLGLRFDCLHDFNKDKGSTQDCLALTGARITVHHELSSEVHAMIQIDPFGTPVSGSEGSPLRDGLPGPTDTALGIFDDFAVVWTPRQNLDLAVEAYEGAANLPSVADLSLGGSLADVGWKQTALTVTYNLSAPFPMRVKFAAGNGEGETAHNLDPQQYFGFEGDWAVYPGIHVVLGASRDGNNVGSEQYRWLAKQYQAGCGFDPTAGKATLGYSTQRLAAGLVMDGTFAPAEGVSAALGWQRTVMGDLDKQQQAGPTAAELASCPSLDVGNLFVEAPNVVNTVQRTVYGASLQYKLFADYFVAIDYESENVDTGSVKLFATCNNYDGSHCTDSASPSNHLTVDALDIGGGVTLTEGLVLSADYFRSHYEKKYAQVYFPAPNGQVSPTQELLNLRLAYNWQ